MTVPIVKYLKTLLLINLQVLLYFKNVNRFENNNDKPVVYYFEKGLI